MFNPAFVTAVWPKKTAGEVELFCGCSKSEEVGSWSKADEFVTAGDCPNSDDAVTAAECSKRMSAFGTTSKVGFEAVMNEKKDCCSFWAENAKVYRRKLPLMPAEAFPKAEEDPKAVD